MPGQLPNQTSPKEIAFPDDDARAMTLICLIIHRQNDYVPKQLDPREVFLVARLGDKYDCLVALEGAFDHWLRPDPKDLLNNEDLGFLMASAYLLDHAEGFEIFTRALIFRYGNSYLHLTDQEYADTIPWRTFRKPTIPKILLLVTNVARVVLLEESRTCIRTAIQHELNGLEYTSLGHKPNTAVYRPYQSAKLLPLDIFQVSIEGILQRMIPMRIPAQRFSYDDGSSLNRKQQEQYNHPAHQGSEDTFFDEYLAKSAHLPTGVNPEPRYQHRDDFDSKMREIEATPGLCLKCVQERNSQLASICPHRLGVGSGTEDSDPGSNVVYHGESSTPQTPL